MKSSNDYGAGRQARGAQVPCAACVVLGAEGPSLAADSVTGWFWGIRYVAIRGERDRLADAMDLVGREVRREEVYGCCERHPMPPLVPSAPNQSQDAPPMLAGEKRSRRMASCRSLGWYVTSVPMQAS
jgi:hypothetical protein